MRITPGTEKLVQRLKGVRVTDADGWTTGGRTGG